MNFDPSQQYKTYNSFGEVRIEWKGYYFIYNQDSDGFLHSSSLRNPAVYNMEIAIITHYFHGIKLTKEELILELNRERMLNEIE